MQHKEQLNIRRVSVNLPEEDFKLLKLLAGEFGMSMTDVIRRGIHDEQFFRSIRADKSKILVKSMDGSVSVVVEK